VADQAVDALTEAVAVVVAVVVVVPQIALIKQIAFLKMLPVRVSFLHQNHVLQVMAQLLLDQSLKIVNTVKVNAVTLGKQVQKQKVFLRAQVSPLESFPQSQK
jgi:hypothetical protein